MLKSPTDFLFIGAKVLEISFLQYRVRVCVCACACVLLLARLQSFIFVVSFFIYNIIFDSHFYNITQKKRIKKIIC